MDARYIHSGTPLKERKELLDDFRAGVFQVLVNCAILTEGADVPNIDCVVVVRPTRSRNVFAQMVMFKGYHIQSDSDVTADRAWYATISQYW